MPDIILHLGAHKTATTSLQRSLANNQRMLAQNGVLVPGLNGFREAVSANLRSYLLKSAMDWPLRKILQKEFSQDQIKNCRTLVLSDENIIGYCDFIFTKGQFYTEIPKRCGLFNEWLGVSPEKIVFSIRPYADYFLSAYGQWLRSGTRFTSRSDAQQTVMQLSRGWADIIEDICNSFPNSQIVVSEYRRRKEFTLAQFEALLGAAAADIKHDKKMFWNKGLTDEKLQKLEAARRDANLTDAQLKSLGQQKIWGWPAVNKQFWSDADRQVLDMKYQADRDRIIAMTRVKALFE